jgi:hypothetical protein
MKREQSAVIDSYEKGEKQQMIAHRTLFICDFVGWK